MKDEEETNESAKEKLEVIKEKTESFLEDIRNYEVKGNWEKRISEECETMYVRLGVYLYLDLITEDEYFKSFKIITDKYDKKIREILGLKGDEQ